MSIIAKISLFKTPYSSFLSVLAKYCYFKLFGLRILMSGNTHIYGIANIYTKGVLKIGMNYVGFMHKKDLSLLNVRGKLSFAGGYSIGKGCRFDIGENAVVSFGKGGYITANSTFVIMHGLAVGDECVISWNCQFLDDDFHTVDYESRKKELDPKIVLGNHVWIGSGVKIYKGTKVANGSIIASDSVLKGIFEEENVIIAGNPAKIIKRNVSWK